MCETIKRHSQYIHLSIIFSIISSVSILAAALVNSENINQVVLIVFALIFWIGLLLEQVLFWKANKLRKDLAKNDKRAHSGKRGFPYIAATKEGFAFDVVFAVSLIALIVCMIFHLGEVLLQYIFISLLVLSFRLHCIFNGLNYRYIKYRKGKS